MIAIVIFSLLSIIGAFLIFVLIYGDREFRKNHKSESE